MTTNDQLSFWPPAALPPAGNSVNRPSYACVCRSRWPTPRSFMTHVATCHQPATWVRLWARRMLRYPIIEMERRVGATR